MSTKITTPELVKQIKDDFDDVYDAGYAKGKVDGGDSSYYDTFWDIYQKKGQPCQYQFAFARGRFDDTNYNPKYPIVTDSSSGGAASMYYGTNISNTKVTIDISRTAGVSGMFNYCYYLVTIPKIVVSETTGALAFYQCPKLENVTVEGIIANNWEATDAPLTRKSILSIYDALSTTTTGNTVTFKKTAVNAAFTDEEWKTLTDAKPNWEFKLYEKGEG